jgi:hypothetical protein
MSGLLSFLAGPLDGLLKTVRGLVDDVTTTSEEKLQKMMELEKVGNEFKVQVLAAEAQWVEAQKDVIVAEMKSESWLARNWRPILMLVFTYVILNNYVLTAYFGLPSVDIPVHMWELLKLGVGGYIVGRSAEKVIPNVAQVLSMLRTK